MEVWEIEENLKRVPKRIERISIVGNAASGKTRLARKLSEILQIPVFHIDSVQFFGPGMQLRPPSETKAKILEKEHSDDWIIDGIGPYDLLEERFSKSDLILYIDLPLHLNIFWFLIRQIQLIWMKRSELSADCSENSWDHVRRVFRNIFNTHQKMRPGFYKMLSREKFKNKTLVLRSKTELDLLPKIFDRLKNDLKS